MGKQTRFNKRVVVGDRLEADVQGKAPNVGTMNLVQRLDIDFNDSNGQQLFAYLPDEARLIDIVVDVKVAWNAGTSSVISVGRPGNINRYVQNEDLQGLKRFLGTDDSTKVNSIRSDSFSASAQYLVYQITNVGAAPTAGQATLEVWYDLGDNDTT